MKLLIRLLLAANIILVLVAGPLIVAGGGLGAGAGGSSFLQKTDLKGSEDQRSLALTIVQNVCDQSKWKVTDGVNFPQDINAISNLAKIKGEIDWTKSCVQKDDGIKFVGDLKQEFTTLFSDQWDARILYAIGYLYQKRFSAQGYDVSCSSAGKSAYSMTVAVHSGPSGSYINPTNGQALQDLNEDSKETTPDNDKAVSAHARGQAFDVLSYGCTTIKADGEVKAVMANYLSYPSGQDAKTVADELAKATGQDATAYTNALSNPNTDSAVLMAQQTVSANAPELSIASGALEAPGAAGAMTAYLETNAQLKLDGTTTSGDAIDALVGANTEAGAGLQIGSYDQGAKPAQVGKKSLEQRLGTTLDNKVLIDEALKAGGPALNLSADVVSALRSKDIELAARLQGAREINNDLKLNLSEGEITSLAQANVASAELLAKSILVKKLPIERSQITLALLQGGYSAVSTKLQNADEARKNEKPYLLAQSLYNAGSLSVSQIATISDFLGGDAIARDGAVRRFEDDGGDSGVLNWMKSSKNMSDADIKDSQKTIQMASKSSDMRENLKPLLANAKSLAATEFYNLLSPLEQRTFSQVIGKTPPSADDLEKAVKSGQLEQALKASQLAKQLASAGLSNDDATSVACGILSKDKSLQTSALDFYNKKNKTTFTVADFKSSKTPGGNSTPPKAAIYYAKSNIAKFTGLTVDQVSAAIDKKDTAALGPIVDKYAAKYKLPKGLFSSFLRKDTKEQSGEGVKIQAKRVALESDGTPQEKKGLEDKLSDEFDKAINKGEDLARQEASKILVDLGMSTDDANGFANGDFSGAQYKVIAATMNKKGIMSYETAKDLLDRPSADEKYAGSDVLLAYTLRQEGQNFQVPTGFSETMLEGPADKRQDQMLNVGAQMYAPKLVQLASKSGVNLTSEQATQILQNRDFKTLQNSVQESKTNEAIDRISGSTGVPTDVLKNIYKDVQTSGGDIKNVDMENTAWSAVESYTGISKETVTNFDTNFSSFKDGMVAKYQNAPGQIMNNLAGVGAGIIVGKLIGGELARIDPTGGLLTSYVMSYATQFLMSSGIAAPYLIAAGLLLDSKATIAALEGMIKQYTQIFTNPGAFITGILGTYFGIGKKKPFTGVVFNSDAAKRDTLNITNGVLLPTDATTDTVDPAGSNAPQANALDPATAALAPQTAAQTGATSSFALSKYLASASEPTPQYLQAVNQRSLDQVIEDMMVFSLVTSNKYRNYQSLQGKHWKPFMGNIKQPSSEAGAKQVLSPQIIKDGQEKCALSDVAKGKPVIYDGETLSSAPLGITNLIALGQLVYGLGFSSACNYGRSQGLLYDDALTNASKLGSVHFGV